MDKSDINIIDIRKHCGLNTTILGFEVGEILFAKQVKINNKHYYSVNKYNIKAATIKEIYKYEILEAEFYSQYAYVIGQHIMIIKMNFKNANNVEVDILDKVSEKRISTHCFEAREEVISIPIIINSRYFIFYTEIDEKDTNNYIRYTEQGYVDFIYLCDLLENKMYFIKDIKLVKGLSVVHGLLDCLPTFIHDGEEYLIFNETYMDDYEYEQCIFEAIKANKLAENIVTEIEGLYYIRVNDFVESIKLGQSNIPFRKICSRYLDGWVQYISTDEQNIYFREKDFNNQIEKVYAISKQNFESKIVIEIPHKNLEGSLFYGDKIYEKIELEDNIKIRGIHNCHYNLCFKTDKHMWFGGLINERYLITSSWIEDEENNYLEFVYISDTKEDRDIKCEGACRIYNNNIVLYNNGK